MAPSATSTDVHPTDEWELIRRCRAGAAAAFEPLVRAHEGPALAIAGALLGDGDEAADAVQDAFVRAHDSLGRLRPGSTFGPWFRTIVRNICLDRLRSPRRRALPLRADAVDRVRWRDPEPLRHLERDELAEAVRDALAQLSDEHRAVLVLKEMEGLAYADIARVLGVPPGTVGSRLHHARMELRDVLLARGITMEHLVR